MRCRRCAGPAVIEVRRNNSAFCKGCFVVVVREQVRKAIRRFDMLDPRDRVLIAVSGGKDSLALWDILLELGYDASGLYLGLGIGDYSDRSREIARGFASERGADLIEVDLADDYGFDIPTAGAKGPRSTCAVCGLSKRYVFNRAALDGGFDVVATGHNLDDEAANLLGNTLRWNVEYIARQSPSLPAKPGMVKKVKPLHRLSELETAAYAFLRGIDYVVEECPLVAGNTQFVADLCRAVDLADTADLLPCERCDQPTTGRFCAFCRARAQILGERLDTTAEPDREVAAELSDEVLPAEIYGGAG